MPILSLVIPTRNRPACLLDCVNVTLANTADTEIVVSDNSDTDALRSILDEANQSGRLKYVYSNEQLSVVDNFERSLRECTGDYIMFVGDDDAIGPQVEQIAYWAKEQAIDAVTSYRSAFLANYFWPGVVSKYFGDEYSASLFVNRCTGAVEITDAMDALRTVATRLGGGLGSLPRAYHGLVSRDLICSIRQRYGRLFGGVSPDIFSAALISASCQKAVHLDFPFIIPGASPKSTAGLGAERKDRGDLRSNDHISRFGESLKWDSRIPSFYSPHTVWAYSLCKALDELNLSELKPGFTRLYACCLLYYPAHWQLTLVALLNHAREAGHIRVALYLIRDLVLELKAQFQRVTNKIRRLSGRNSQLQFGGLPTISAAYYKLVEHLNVSGITPLLRQSTPTGKPRRPK
jgi:glycosyltransferase involved in cell wall biosynthesis